MAVHSGGGIIPRLGEIIPRLGEITGDVVLETPTRGAASGRASRTRSRSRSRDEQMLVTNGPTADAEDPVRKLLESITGRSLPKHIFDRLSKVVSEYEKNVIKLMAAREKEKKLLPFEVLMELCIKPCCLVSNSILNF